MSSRHAVRSRTAIRGNGLGWNESLNGVSFTTRNGQIDVFEVREVIPEVINHLLQKNVKLILSWHLPDGIEPDEKVT